MHSSDSGLAPVTSTPVVDFDVNSVADDPDEQLTASAAVDDLAPSDPFVLKFRESLSSFNQDNFSEFSDLLEEFISLAQAHVKLPPPRAPNASRREVNPGNRKEIQKLYRRNHSNAVRRILGETNKMCELPHEDIIAHLCPPSAQVSNAPVFHFQTCLL